MPMAAKCSNAGVANRPKTILGIRWRRQIPPWHPAMGLMMMTGSHRSKLQALIQVLQLRAAALPWTKGWTTEDVPPLSLTGQPRRYVSMLWLDHAHRG